MTTVTLDAFDLALAALLVILNAGLSLRLGLALERPLLVAAVRTAVQLFLVGLVKRGGLHRFAGYLVPLAAGAWLFLG